MFWEAVGQSLVDQLTKHISIVQPLSFIKHGFRQGRSTVANLLACDAPIASHLDKGDPLDIIFLEYQRAFDKKPRDLMLDSLYKLNIHPTIIALFASFFSGCTFQVVVDEVESEPTDVKSEVIKGLVLTPVCFCIFLDPLPQAVIELTGPDSYEFADDFKFVAGASPREHHQAQSVVNLLIGWSKDHKMPSSLNKSSVLHYGNNNPILQNIFDGHLLPIISQFKDQGVLRSERVTYRDHKVANYVAQHCTPFELGSQPYYGQPS